MAFRQFPPSSKFIKCAAAGKAQGIWDRKKHTFSFQMPSGTTEAHMTFKGTGGIFEFDFTTFECSGSHIEWGDADFDFHSSEYLLEREYDRSSRKHPFPTNYPFPRCRAHKTGYNPARPAESARTSPGPHHHSHSPSTSAARYNTSRSRSRSPSRPRLVSHCPCLNYTRLNLPYTIHLFLDEICENITNLSDFHNLAIECDIPVSKVDRAIADHPANIKDSVIHVLFDWWGTCKAPFNTKINTLQNGFRHIGHPAKFEQIITNHKTVHLLSTSFQKNNLVAAASAAGPSSPTLDDPHEQTDNSIVIEYESEESDINSDPTIGNGEGVDQSNEDPQESQAILANGAMTGGIVRFTVPSDGMKIVSLKTLHDKLNPKVVMNKVDVKRVESVEL